MDLSDSESDVDDVEPDPTTAVESLCPPVVTQTRPRRAVTQPRPGSCVGDVMSDDVTQMRPIPV